MSKKYGQPKVQVARESPRESCPEPRQHYNKDYRKEDHRKEDYRDRRSTNYQIGDPYQERRWNTYTRPPSVSSPVINAKPYCEIHGYRGHQTKKCRLLQDFLLEDFEKEKQIPNSKEGALDKDLGNAVTRFHQARRVAKQGVENELSNHNPSSGTSQKRDSNQRMLPPPPKRRINMIMGGLIACNDSVRSIKAYTRQASPSRESREQTIREPRSLENSNCQSLADDVISFATEDLEGVDVPHNDPLVIELDIGDHVVEKIMIDTGSSVDLIFRETLQRMGIRDSRIKAKSKPLTSFDGEAVMTVGTIKLPVMVGGITEIIKFDVIDRPTIYNVILGTPWLFTMKAVASTYHQCVKFPTTDGVFAVRGNQRTARTCFIKEHKLRKSARACSITTFQKIEPADDGPTDKEAIIQVNIDESDLERCVGIGANLNPPLYDQLVAFLRANSSTFAWSTADMTGVDPAKACHELNVDPTHKPIRQKRRKLGPERARAVNDEVERLSKAGSIMEVKYPEWLANPVVVKKKSGKWRVCVDFTDLNKACPKDSFPLPHIDRLVEATAGNELLSFMDAFSGYNQITMHPDDREKTAFITERGTYCYRVMPFGLKNAGATYQRLVNQMFAEQLGTTMEVYIDDMLVKSQYAANHVDHLATCFASLNIYGMKLNPTKCTFAVTSGEFLGYIITKRGIEANPAKIAAILDLPSPQNTREVQRLTGRIAALNRFISRSTDRCLPFYQLLRGNKHFQWGDECEQAFARLKEYLTTPPVLATPELGDTLYLYVAVSHAAVSGVLVREDRGEQRPINYISKSLIDPETRYSAMEKLALAVITSARKLRPYFQSHSIAVMSDQPLRTILHSPTQSGRMVKWAIELSEYDIEYRGRTATKSQVLADFIIELPPEIASASTKPSLWNLYVDGASSRNGSGVGIRLISPTGEIIEQSFRLAFPASNNEAEYEALLAGLRLAKALGAKGINAYCDSQLVASQFNGDYETRNDRMEAYLQTAQKLAREFDAFALVKIPRSDNSSADALAALASTSDPSLRRMIPVESIDFPSIDFPKATFVIADATDKEIGTQAEKPNIEPMEEEPDHGDWRNEIRSYIGDGALPDDKWVVRRIKAKSARYTMIDGNLFRWSASGTLLTCIDSGEAAKVMQEVHEGAGGNHSGGRMLALKIKKQGLFWPSMIKDSEDFAKSCEKCQRHGPLIQMPATQISVSVAPYPFMRWAMDVIGPFPPSRQKRFVLVMTDYFTKWVEAESYARIQATDVRKFVWKFIICRHGLPHEIVTDNGSQFISPMFENFCARWNIRLNKSTPRYPQGNGQAEATNKTIVDGLKKRLDDRKGAWADELDGVLWSHRTTPRRATNQTPFSLSHGMEAMSPAEVSANGPRQAFLVDNASLNHQMMVDAVDNLEEERNKALLRIQNYQQSTTKYYNARVRNRHLVEGDLVLRKVFENTRELNAGKLGANWEGPYIISRIIKPAVYELLEMNGALIPRAWNIINLKKYYY